MRGSFRGGVFAGKEDFPWEGELDFSALIKRLSKIKQKNTFFQLKLGSNIKT
jgi:hypothetical protein